MDEEEEAMVAEVVLEKRERERDRGAEGVNGYGEMDSYWSSERGDGSRNRDSVRGIRKFWFSSVICL